VPAPTVTTSGPLPGGVTLAANGTLGGTPTEGGTFPITITASNGVAPDATQDFTLRVYQPPTFTSANATTFTVGQQDSFTVAASGVPAHALSMTPGSLPTGVTFDPTTGALSGTPAAGTGGSYTLQFTAANGIVPNAVQTFSLVVDEAPSITSANEFTFVLNA